MKIEFSERLLRAARNITSDYYGSDRYENDVEVSRKAINELEAIIREIDADTRGNQP
jgi:hypothetical protein